jgi:hypothetical protein
MRKVELNSDWQGGPAGIEVEGDVIASDVNGTDVPGVILTVWTEADIGAGDDETELTLGSGRWVLSGLKNASSKLTFSVAASDEQARALIDALEAEMEPGV